MRTSDRQRIVDEQRRRSDVERQYQAAQLPKGMSELAWFIQRHGDAGVRAALSADARGGAEAVKQVLRDAGLTAAGLHAFDVQYARGNGLQGVGAAVQAQIAHERQATIAQDATAALERLGPQDWQAVRASLAADPSGQQLAQRAVALGMSREAAAVAVRRLVTDGLEPTRQAVTESAQARARAEATHAAAERDLAERPRDAAWDPLASEQMAQASLTFYATHAAALEAAGVGRNRDESPVRWVQRIARSGDDVARKVAEVTNTDPKVLRTILADTRLHEDHRTLRTQLRDSDEKMRKARAVPLGDRKPVETKRKADPLDAAFEKARATMPPEERRPVRAESVEDAAVATAAGRDFKLTTDGKRHAAKAVERRNAPRGTALDRAIHAAEDKLAGRSDAPAESDDAESTETTNGGSTDAE